MVKKTFPRILVVSLSVGLLSALILFFYNQRRASSFEEVDIDILPLLSTFKVDQEALNRQFAIPLAQFGKKLFFDTQISSTGKIACATCHQPNLGFTDQRPNALGKSETLRNTPTLINLATHQWFMHDGRAGSLETQALLPLENPLEHDFDRGRLYDYVRKTYVEDYVQNFGPLPKLSGKKGELGPARPRKSENAEEADTFVSYILHSIQNPLLLNQTKAFLHLDQMANTEVIRHLLHVEVPADPEAISRYEGLSPLQRKVLDDFFLNIGKAIAEYVKSIQAYDSPFDRFVEKALRSKDIHKSMVEGFGPEELKGFKVFLTKGKCVSCHFGPQFTNQQFHNIGLKEFKRIDLGRSEGLRHFAASPFACRSSDKKSEACQEKSFLDPNNVNAIGAFKTPTLRNLPMTFPYGHNGSIPDLESFLRHYTGSFLLPTVGSVEDGFFPVELTEKEIAALSKFLTSLNSPVESL